VVIETDNPILIDPAEAIKTAESTDAIRQAVIDCLPSKVTRVANIMPEELAILMISAHSAVLEALNQRVFRPPEGYVAPADR
jgi:hypothetical protein